MVEASSVRVSKCFSGELASQPLAMVLANAAEQGTSGTLSLYDGTRESTVILRAGKIAAVRTGAPIAYLGAVLYEQGAIDAATLNETLLEVATSRRLHGAVLVDGGFVTPAQIAAALIEQTYRKVQYLFSLPGETTWTLREGTDELAGARDDDRPAVDPWQAVRRGLRENPRTAHAARTLATLDGGFRLRSASSLDRLGLSPQELAFCEGLAEPTTVAGLLASSPLSAEQTTLLVYLLALARCLVRMHVRPASPLELGERGVRELAARIGRTEPHVVLGVPPNASKEAIRAAYFKVARSWHCSRIPRELDGVRAECEQVFVQLREALRVLTDPPSVRDDRVGARLASAGEPVAAPTMRDVDAALARGHLDGATKLAQVMLWGGAHGPAARAVLAWCAAGAGNARAEELEAAHAALDKLLSGDPECARALFYRGQLAKRLGRTVAAIRDFNKAVRIDPTHVDAQREVRLHAMRTRNISSEHAPSAPAAAVSVPEQSAARSAGVAETGNPRIGSGLRRLFARVVGR